MTKTFPLSSLLLSNLGNKLQLLTAACKGYLLPGKAQNRGKHKERRYEYRERRKWGHFTGNVKFPNTTVSVLYQAWFSIHTWLPLFKESDCSVCPEKLQESQLNSNGLIFCLFFIFTEFQCSIIDGLFVATYQFSNN